VGGGGGGMTGGQGGGGIKGKRKNFRVIKDLVWAQIPSKPLKGGMRKEERIKGGGGGGSKKVEVRSIAQVCWGRYFHRRPDPERNGRCPGQGRSKTFIGQERLAEKATGRNKDDRPKDGGG